MNHSRHIRSIAVAALAAIAVTQASQGQSASVRPHVVLQFRLDALAYRQALSSPDADRLEQALGDIARRGLAQLYPYLDWSGGAGAMDTVDIRVVDKYPPDQVLWTRLRFTLHDDTLRLMRDSAIYQEFEDFAHAFSTRLGPADWAVDTLISQMRVPLLRALADPSLQPRLFGRIPILARAQIQAGVGLVPVSTRDLLISPDSNPTFLITAQVIDAGTQEPGELDLAPCRSTGVHFRCSIAKLVLTHVGTEELPPRAGELARKDTILPFFLMIRTFTRAKSAGLSGAVYPDGR